MAEEIAQQEPVNAPNLSDQAQIVLNEITTILTDVKAAKSKIQQILSNVTPLSDKVMDPATGVQATLTAATADRAKIIETKADAEQKLKEIAENHATAKAKVTEITTFLTSFEPLRDKVMDPATGVQATVDKIITYEQKAIQAKNSAEDEHLQSKKLRESISLLEEESSADHDKVRSHLTDSESLKNDIQKHLDLVSDSARTDAFIQRKNELSKEVEFWKGSLLIGLILLSALFGVLYWGQISDGGFKDWHDLYRYVFTIPVMYFVTLSSKNYSEARLYLEKYSFKAVTSVTLEAYTKIMRDKFREHTNELFNFMEKTISSIYTEPYSNVKTKRSTTFNFKPNMIAKAEEETENINPKKN